MLKRKVPLIILAMTLIAVLVATCDQRDQPVADPRGQLYAGSASCAGCHKELASSWVHNSHFNTSAPVDPDSLRVRLHAAYRFYYPDSSAIRFEERAGKFYQAWYPQAGNAADVQIRTVNEISSARFDLAFGSGGKAQTYAGWNGDDLLELPLSWYSVTGVWANSPGFPMEKPRYNRIIPARCFECHSSFVKKDEVQSGPLAVKDRLDKSSIVYGIDCERCHGPAADHVSFQTEHKGEAGQKDKAGFRAHAERVKYGSISSLPRERQLDLCGGCHGGNDRDTKRPLFEFVPGDTLSQFYYPAFMTTQPEPDVHGNQLGLLQASECFKASNMTCGSCHSTHGPAATSTYTAKCMACHQQSIHAKNEEALNQQTIRSSCIDCHMPLKESRAISFNNGAGLEKIPYFLRTHKIAVYAP